jgi:hypothetical protein
MKKQKPSAGSYKEGKRTVESGTRELKKSERILFILLAPFASYGIIDFINLVMRQREFHGTAAVLAILGYFVVSLALILAGVRKPVPTVLAFGWHAGIIGVFLVLRGTMPLYAALGAITSIVIGPFIYLTVFARE